MTTENLQNSGELEKYIAHLEARYERLRKKRKPLTGITSQAERLILSAHNARIKFGMKAIKVCIDNAKGYLKEVSNE